MNFCNLMLHLPSRKNKRLDAPTSLWCCDSSWKGLLWDFVLTMALNTWADGNKKYLLLGLSFANFENDLVRWDVHIKWPLTRSYLLRQAPNMGPHLNQFLSDRIFLWYSMEGTNADTMVKGWGAHHLLRSKCVSILLRAAIHSTSEWCLNHFVELLAFEVLQLRDWIQ